MRHRSSRRRRTKSTVDYNYDDDYVGVNKKSISKRNRILETLLLRMYEIQRDDSYLLILVGLLRSVFGLNFPDNDDADVSRRWAPSANGEFGGSKTGSRKVAPEVGICRDLLVTRGGRLDAGRAMYSWSTAEATSWTTASAWAVNRRIISTFSLWRRRSDSVDMRLPVRDDVIDDVMDRMDDDAIRDWDTSPSWSPTSNSTLPGLTTSATNLADARLDSVVAAALGDLSGPTAAWSRAWQVLVSGWAPLTFRRVEFSARLVSSLRVVVWMSRCFPPRGRVPPCPDVSEVSWAESMWPNAWSFSCCNLSSLLDINICCSQWLKCNKAQGNAVPTNG